MLFVEIALPHASQATRRDFLVNIFLRDTGSIYEYQALRPLIKQVYATSLWKLIVLDHYKTKPALYRGWR